MIAVEGADRLSLDNLLSIHTHKSVLSDTAAKHFRIREVISLSIQGHVSRKFVKTVVVESHSEGCSPAPSIHLDRNTGDCYFNTL